MKQWAERDTTARSGIVKLDRVVMSPRCELVLPGNARASNGTRCHKNVILIVVNGGKVRMKGE
jgi:hypothetical protein